MKPETRSFYEHTVQDTIARIVLQMDDALDLGALASAAGLSPFHFHRMFRGMVGETPLELQRRLRMERAARALAEGTQPIIEVALDAGYETHEAFTRAFRASFGTSPSGFREQPRPPYQLQAASGVHYAADCSLLRFMPYRIERTCHGRHTGTTA